MDSQTKILRLHDRMTRGKKLSSEEYAQLQTWYEKQDKAEFEVLQPKARDTTRTALEDKIKETEREIFDLTNQIQKLTSENEALRWKNATLALRRQRYLK